MKQLFIVAPHFPPSSAPPAQRVRLLVKHCTRFGYFPTVFTVDHKYREEIIDDWMCQLLGDDFAVIKVRCFDQRKSRKLGIGDLGLRMLPFLFLALKKEAKLKKPAFILFPVPPWYIMILGPIIKKMSGIKYGIDFINGPVKNAKKYTAAGSWGKKSILLIFQ
jgi:hypothetical protein